MLRRPIILAWAFVSAPAIAPAHAEERACYDIAVVGRVLASSNFVDLNDLLEPLSGDRIWWGGRSDLRIRVEVSSGSMTIPDNLTVQAITSAQPKRSSAILFHIQKLEDGRYFAVDWEWARPDWHGRYDAKGEAPPPKCTTDSKRISVSTQG
jgi:hypothetical protein